ncbi:MAG: hypothetical protein ABJJ87_01815, partial [Lentilitoribacter sp.]
MSYAVDRSGHETVNVRAIESLASSYYGKKMNFHRSEKINFKSSVDVSRAWLVDHDRKGITVIAKHHNNNIPKYILPYFNEETLNYNFLMSIRDEFDKFPKLYGNNQCLFVLEDLGKTSQNFKNEMEIMESIARTFSDLHKSTFDKKNLYEISRTYHEIKDDLRDFSNNGQHDQFIQGANILANYVEITTKHSMSRFIKFAMPILEDIRFPGHFESFIHGDMICARQSVYVDGVVKLLDFEHGRFAHSLIDLAVFLIGKIEINTNIDKLHYSHINLSAQLAAIYRKMIQEKSGRVISDTIWNRNLASCFFFQAIILIKTTEMTVGK